MAKTGFKSVGDYIVSRPLGVQLALTRVRNVIRQALPGAEEGMSSDMPAYKTAAGQVVSFAGGKDHFSLSPVSEKVAKTFKRQLVRYTVSRDAIRFPLSQPMPVDLIAGIAKLRAKECAEEAAARKSEKATKKAVKKPAKKTKAKKAAAKKVVARKAASKKPAAAKARSGKKS